MTSLHAELTRHSILKDELLRRFPSLADDEQALIDTLDGISDLKEQITEVIRSAEDDEMLADAISDRIDQLKARQERLRTRSKGKRDAAFHAMQEAGIKKIEAPDATISLARSPVSVLITDDALIPGEYLRQPEPPAPKPDKKAIKEALVAGQEIPGCILSNGGARLLVRKG